jgi:hypothetical protein
MKVKKWKRDILERMCDLHKQQAFIRERRPDRDPLSSE